MSAGAPDDGSKRSSTPSDQMVENEELEGSVHLLKQCSICNRKFTDPIILGCLHVFDRGCIMAHQKCRGLVDYVECPKCDRLSVDLKSSQPFDLYLIDHVEPPVEHADVVKCSVCTEEKEAQYRCIQCEGTLCARCRDTHKVCLLLFCYSVGHEIIFIP